MKKIIKILSILMLLIPGTVLADMSAPDFGYKVIVTNPNGVKDEEGNIIPFETKCYVTDEWVENNKLTLNLACDDYEGGIGVTDIDSIRVVDDNPVFDKSQMTSENISEFYAEEDIKLYNNAYLASKENGQVIKAGTSFIGYVADDNWLWYYYEDGNTHGYFHINYEGYEKVEITEKVNFQAILTQKPEIYKDYYKKSKLNASIPISTIFTITKIAPFYGDSFYYVTYNGIEGWIDADDFSRKGNYKVVVTNKSKLRIYDNEFKRVKNVNLKENTLYEAYYAYDADSAADHDFYYVYTKVDDKYYWIQETGYNEDNGNEFENFGIISEPSKYEDEHEYNLTTKKEISLSDGILIPSNSQIISYIADGNYEDDEYKYSRFFVTYNGISGWVDANDLIIDGEDEEASIDDQNSQSQTPTNTTNNTLIGQFANLKKYALYGVIVAVILAITVIVTIILINRKKHNKNQ